MTKLTSLLVKLIIVAIISLPLIFLSGGLTFLFVCRQAAKYDASAKFGIAISSLGEYLSFPFLFSAWPFLALGYFIFLRIRFGPKDADYLSWAMIGAIIGMWIPYALLTFAEISDLPALFYACNPLPPPNTVGGNFGWIVLMGMYLWPVAGIGSIIGWFSGRLASDLWNGRPFSGVLLPFLVGLVTVFTLLVQPFLG